MIFRFPLNYIGIVALFHEDGYKQKYGSEHNGVDLVWKKKTGTGQPILAAADGEVIYVIDNDNTGKSWGNCVKISHGDGWYTMYGHLKAGAKVVKGQKVKQGDVIGIMGNTGYSFGEHLHFEVYKGGSSTSKRVDPLLYTYVFEGQEVHPEDINKVKYYKPITSIVNRDTSKDQLEVLLKDINVRTSAGVNSSTLGYCPKGIYNYYEVKENVDYTWYRIADDQWIAQNKANTYLKIMPKEIIEEPVEEPKEDIMKIEELEKKIAELEDKIKIDEEVIFELRKELNEYDNMKKYIAQEDSFYKITLNQGDELYLKTIS